MRKWRKTGWDKLSTTDKNKALIAFARDVVLDGEADKASRKACAVFLNDSVGYRWMIADLGLPPGSLPTGVTQQKLEKLLW